MAKKVKRGTWSHKRKKENEYYKNVKYCTEYCTEFYNNLTLKEIDILIDTLIDSEKE